MRHIQLLEKYKQNFDEGRPFIGKIASWIDYTAAVTAVYYWLYPRGPTRPHEAYEISKSRDFEPDFLISNLISVDF